MAKIPQAYLLAGFPSLRSDRDSNSGYAFGVYTLSRQLSPIVNDWLIISCLKLVPACAYVARKIYAAKLIIFFDVAITFAPFLSFFFLSVRDVESNSKCKFMQPYRKNASLEWRSQFSPVDDG